MDTIRTSLFSCLVGAFLLAAQAPAQAQTFAPGGGIDPARVYSLTNADFESGNMSSWSSFPTPSVWSASTAQAKAGSYSARAVLSSPSSGSLWTSTSVTAPDPDIAIGSTKLFGEKVMSGIWFYLSSVTVHGTVRVGISSYTGTNVLIAERTVDTSTLPIGSWVYLQPVPMRSGTQVQGEEGRIVAGTSVVTFFVEYSGIQGTFHVDSLRAGRFDYISHGPSNNSFESASLLGGHLVPTSWAKTGSVEASSAASDDFSNPAYYGKRYAKLTSSGSTTKIEQTDSITPESYSPKHGDKLRASIWIRCNSGSSGTFKIVLSARSSSGSLQELASLTYSPTSGDFASGRWIYLETPDSVSAVPFVIGSSPVTQTRVSYQSTINGEVWVDFAQVGQLHATNGNPSKYVIADVEMSYRAQDDDDLDQLRAAFDGTSAELPPGSGNEVFDAVSSATRKWLLSMVFGNWAWVTAEVDEGDCYDSVTPPSWPGCNPNGLKFWQHDPSLLDRSTPCDRRANGRLDIATSIDNPVSVVGGSVSLTGADDLPLTGAYSNSDEDLIRWQIALGKAAGIDAFSLELIGHAASAEAWYTNNEYPFGLDTSEFWWAADDTVSPHPIPGSGDWGTLDPTHPVAPRSEIAAEYFWEIAEQTDVKLVPIMVLGAHTGGAGNPSWIGLTDPNEQIEAIQYDICRYVQYYFDRKATLKLNGEMVIGIFWQLTELYDGSSLEEHWDEIVTEVNAHLPAGRKVRLLGTTVQGVSDGNPANEDFKSNWLSPEFSMLSPWRPLDAGWYGSEPTSFLHKYKTFIDFVNGDPLLHPAADSNTSLDWNTKATEAAKDLAWRVTQWSSVDDSSRLPLGFIYDDFDNSGITGVHPAMQSATLGSVANRANVCVQIMSEEVTDMLGKTIDANLAAGIDWLHLCTWNGWNESTRVEPLWDEEYWSASQGGSFDPDADPRTYMTGTTAEKDAKYERIFGRLLRLQEKVATYKGITLDPDALHEITGAYLEAQANATVRAFK